MYVRCCETRLATLLHFFMFIKFACLLFCLSLPWPMIPLAYFLFWGNRQFYCQDQMHDMMLVVTDRLELSCAASLVA